MLNLINVSKIFPSKKGPVKALENASLQVEPGEFIVIRGHSGCGKTTLLLTIGGMQRPTNGKVIFGKQDIYTLSPSERAVFRVENIGFIFQMFHLVPYLNVIDNVMFAGVAGANHLAKDQAVALLSRFGLGDRLYHKSADLSTGEKQRTAIARAMVNHAKVILADEPTGNLDPENTAEVIEYLAEFNRSGGTVILATHGSAAEQYADRIILLKNGRIESSNNKSKVELPLVEGS
jgi:ABC-type lipoprotein export system ATPase subunit